MPQSAELGTHDLVLARLGRREVERNGKTWNEVLLDPQLRHIKRVPHVLSSQRQCHGPVHRDRQGGDYDIVARRHVVLRIQPEIVLAGLVNQFGMRRAELPVRSGIPEIEGELFGLHVDLRSEEHTSELQSQSNLVCRLLLEKKKTTDS